MIFILVIAAFLYLMVSGAVYGPVLRQRQSVCSFRRSSMCDSSCGHGLAAVLAAILWLPALPLFIGGRVGRRLKNEDGVSRVERRRQRELEEADHKIKLARKQQQLEEETSKILEAMQ